MFSQRPVNSLTEDELECPVCKTEYERTDEVLELPCEHIFHLTCVQPWFQQVRGEVELCLPAVSASSGATLQRRSQLIIPSAQCNMCPLCRYEVPTDDPEYEVCGTWQVAVKQPPCQPWPS